MCVFVIHTETLYICVNYEHNDQRDRMAITSIHCKFQPASIPLYLLARMFVLNRETLRNKLFRLYIVNIGKNYTKLLRNVFQEIHKQIRASCERKTEMCVT